MRKLFFIVIILNVLFLAGCSPARLVPLASVEPDQRSEVVVFRENAFNSTLVTMVFGSDGADYVELSNDQYASIYLKNGSSNLFVRSDQADEPFILKTELVAGEKKCLKAYANPSNYGKAFLGGLAFLMGNTFLLEEVACLSDEELAKYKLVSVKYSDS